MLAIHCLLINCLPGTLASSLPLHECPSIEQAAAPQRTLAVGLQLMDPLEPLQGNSSILIICGRKLELVPVSISPLIK